MVHRRLQSMSPARQLQEPSQPEVSSYGEVGEVQDPWGCWSGKVADSMLTTQSIHWLGDRRHQPYTS